MRKAVALAAIGAAVLASGCSREAGAEGGGGGPTTQRNYPAGAFSRIEVTGPYRVDVRTGAAPSVRAQGSAEALERLVVEVKGDRLSIHPRKKNGMNFSWGKGDNATLAVTVPELRGAEIAGSGRLRVDAVRGGDFRGEVAGSGDLRVDRLEVAALNLAIAGSGNALVGGGRAQNVRLEIAGSGDIDTKAVQSERAAVSIAGSGNVSAHASGAAAIEIMGSGDVAVMGGAKCSVSKMGSGKVRCS